MRFRIDLASCLALMFTLMAGAPRAAPHEQFEAPTVDYSADMSTEAGGTTHVAKVFRSHDKTRTERVVRGHSMISIIDRAKHEAISIDQDKHTYTRMDLTQFGASEESPSTDAYTKVFQVEETVSGVETSKFLYEGTVHGTVVKGTVWLSKDNIPMRSIAIVGNGAEATTVASHLENLKVEKQDLALFEVPAGYLPRPTGRLGDKP